MAYALGSAIAPLIGGALTDRVGFRGTTDTIACITMAYAFINFILVLLPSVLNLFRRQTVEIKTSPLLIHL